MPVDQINWETVVDTPCGYTTLSSLTPHRRKERRRGDVLPDALERNPVTCLLEAQFQAQQHLPSAAGPVDRVVVIRLPAREAEPGRGVHRTARRGTALKNIAPAVEGIEGRDAALQTEPLVELPRLTERQIPLMERWADQRSRRHVAESSLSRRNYHRVALHIAAKIRKRKQPVGGTGARRIHGSVDGLICGSGNARCREI
jgi:hypothetical protein